MASSGVWENVILAKTCSFDSVQNIFLYNFNLFLIMADVIAIFVGRCFHPFIVVHLLCQLLVLCGRWKTTWGCLTHNDWQMLLPMWQMESHCDEWQMLIAYCGWCYCHCGRWNSHVCWNVSLWQMLLPLWQMEWHWVNVYVVILSSVMLFRTSSHMWGSWYCLCFCWGMDYWPLCI